MAREDSYSQGRAVCDLSVIIVNYNGALVLPRCLKAVNRASGSLSVEVILVDNGSSDGSAEAVERNVPPVRVIRLGRNLGFAAANNVGAAEARGRYLLLLNSDCFVQPGLFDALICRLRRDPRCAVVGPRLVNSDGSLQPSCHNFPSPAVFFLEQSGLWRLIGRVPTLTSRLFIAGPHARVKAVDWLAGACLMVRRQAFDEAGGFDDAFFFYWEEADLCYRLRESGWRVVFEPAAEAVHLGGGSTSSPRMLLQFFRSLYLFYALHFSRRQLWEVRALVKLMALSKAARGFVTSRLSRGRRTAAGTRDSQRRVWLEVARL